MSDVDRTGVIVGLALAVILLSAVLTHVWARLDNLAVQMDRADWHCEQRGVIATQDGRHKVNPEHTYLLCMYGWDENPYVQETQQ